MNLSVASEYIYIGKSCFESFVDSSCPQHHAMVKANAEGLGTAMEGQAGWQASTCPTYR